MGTLASARIFVRRFVPVFVIAVLVLRLNSPAVAAAQLRPHTDQQRIEELLEPGDLDIANPNAVYETYIGPVWDELGVQFFLVFNKAAKTFLYLLNDNPKMDQYEPSQFSSDVTVGMRTSFAFYKDKMADRHILIGAFAGNTQLNNYFDGPFDQLPDNCIEGDALIDALLSIGPAMNGKVDRYGSEPAGEVRYALTTYKYYGAVEDLEPIVDCASKETDPARSLWLASAAIKDLQERKPLVDAPVRR